MSHPPNTTSSSDASGTKFLIAGERPSVRLPRRIVPICVSDPIGRARPRRTAMTPAIVVVLTAPRPTSSTPSLPSAFAIFCGTFTTEKLYHRTMGWFRKTTPSEPLAMTMTGVKLGDRLLVIGAGDPPLIAALATKSGLTGRACVVDADADRLSRAAAAIEREGALVEATCAAWSALPYDAASFDVVIIPRVLAAMPHD